MTQKLPRKVCAGRIDIVVSEVTSYRFPSVTVKARGSADIR